MDSNNLLTDLQSHQNLEKLRHDFNKAQTTLQNSFDLVTNLLNETKLSASNEKQIKKWTAAFQLNLKNLSEAQEYLLQHHYKSQRS